MSMFCQEKPPEAAPLSPTELGVALGTAKLACFGLAGLPVVPSLGLVWPGPVLPALPALPWPDQAKTGQY